MKTAGIWLLLAASFCSGAWNIILGNYLVGVGGVLIAAVGFIVAYPEDD